MHGVIAMGRRQKPGPKPKDGDRYPSGKLKPAEKQQDKGWSPTAIRRALDNAHVLAKAPVLASVLGRMLMEGKITSREASAGFAYGTAIGRLERMDGAPRRHCKGQAYEFGFSGGSDRPIDHHEKQEIIERAELLRSAIPNTPIIAMTIVEEVCCNDQPVHDLHLPGLRAILRRIADKLKLEQIGDAKAPEKPAADSKEDAALYGLSAVDALEQWFVAQRAQVTEFDVSSAERGQWRRLWASGHDANGEVIERHIDIKVHGMLGGALDTRLVKFAEARGWKRRGK